MLESKVTQLVDSLVEGEAKALLEWAWRWGREFKVISRGDNCEAAIEVLK